ncbi:MAG: Rpn family recombination-promoting nuclease/putative transposase [Chitinispirillales bacterium]|jgi:predicted transposase/invertase (TIGR01784 family)|nr:Rpn family recombination-promoting nuclease/putative transposase [Chitinispirillales bacterium]
MSDRTIISFDYAIKYMLRDKANFDILSGFLSELLGRDVFVIELLESESNKADDEAKLNRVDLKAKIDGGEIAVFEIQFYRQVDFFGKILYGVSRAISEQITGGGKYDIKKVYSVSIAYHNLGAKQDYLFLAKMAGFKGTHTGEIIPFAQTKGLTPPPSPAVDIHPEYYLILPNMFDENVKSSFDEWIYTLKTSTVKSGFTASGLKEAADKLDMLKMEPSKRRVYERILENRANENSILWTAIMDGREEGREQGRAEGRAESIRNVAKNLKSGGVDIDMIAKSTGLPMEEILKL